MLYCTTVYSNMLFTSHAIFFFVEIKSAHGKPICLQINVVRNSCHLQTVWSNVRFKTLITQVNDMVRK